MTPHQITEAAYFVRGKQRTEDRIQTNDDKYMLHKELTGSLKSEILITIHLRQDYGGQESETNPNYTNVNAQKKHRFSILDSRWL